MKKVEFETVHYNKSGKKINITSSENKRIMKEIITGVINKALRE